MLHTQHALRMITLSIAASFTLVSAAATPTPRINAIALVERATSMLDARQAYNITCSSKCSVDAINADPTAKCLSYTDGADLLACLCINSDLVSATAVCVSRECPDTSPWVQKMCTSVSTTGSEGGPENQSSSSQDPAEGNGTKNGADTAGSKDTASASDSSDATKPSSTPDAGGSKENAESPAGTGIRLNFGHGMSLLTGSALFFFVI
ncbi:hypothetical protein BKA62DRAFT_674233 [Auriculariales sp. MPI-PUGE-AT-0066]|nr:hypothetical protein BKA62DRAFT_674233 [Auriculariales sp. MPI-PUGE-AT-0066]